MTTLELRRIRFMLGLSRLRLSKMMGLSSSAVTQIEKGLIPIEKHEEKIKQVLREHIATKKAAMEEEIAFLESLLK